MTAQTRTVGHLRRFRRTWVRLSSRDRFRLVEALVLLPTIALANRLFGFKRVQRLLASTAPQSHPGDTLGSDEIARIVSMIELAARRGVFRANCLHRSMATWWMLRRRGVETVIQFGVRPRAGGLRPDFHAWVERDGVVLNDIPTIADEFFAFEGSLVGGSWS